jgi:hypothetical protein
MTELNFMDRSLNDRAVITLKSSNNFGGTNAGTLYIANSFVEQLDSKKIDRRETSLDGDFRNAEPIDIDAEIGEHPFRCKQIILA